MEPVRGQDDRKRERHAMDGVWLPAGERRPGARGFPGSRHTPRPGVKEAWPYAPLPPPPSGRLANHISRQRAERTNRHRLLNKPTRAENGGLRSTQPTLRCHGSGEVSQTSACVGEENLRPKTG